VRIGKVREEGEKLIGVRLSSNTLMREEADWRWRVGDFE